MAPCARCSLPRATTCPRGAGLGRTRSSGTACGCSSTSPRAAGVTAHVAATRTTSRSRFPELRGLADAVRRHAARRRGRRPRRTASRLRRAGRPDARARRPPGRRARGQRNPVTLHGLRPAAARRRGPHRRPAGRAARDRSSGLDLPRRLAGAPDVRRRRDAAATPPASRGSRASSASGSPRATTRASAASDWLKFPHRRRRRRTSSAAGGPRPTRLPARGGAGGGADRGRAASTAAGSAAGIAGKAGRGCWQALLGRSRGRRLAVRRTRSRGSTRSAPPGCGRVLVVDVRRWD